MFERILAALKEALVEKAKAAAEAKADSLVSQYKIVIYNAIDARVASGAIPDGIAADIKADIAAGITALDAEIESLIASV